MPTPSLIIPSAPVYDEGNLYGLNVYGTQFFPEAIPFTRATTATRTNAAGLVELVPYNLVSYSEQFENAAWTKTNASVTANTTTSPSGLIDADKLIPNATFGVHNAIQAFSIPSSTAYTVSVYAKKAEYSALRINYISSGNTFVSVNLDTGVIASAGGTIYLSSSIANVGNGWYRITMTFTPPVAANALNFIVENPVGITNFSGNGADGIYLWGAQLVEGTEALPYQQTITRLNRPRVDFSLGGCPNLLLESQRTNLALYSQDFADVAWAKLRTTVTQNTTNSPDNTLNADTIEVSSSGQAYFGQAVTTTVGTVNVSIYCKYINQQFLQIYSSSSGQAYANFDILNGVVGSIGTNASNVVITPAANGFYRISVALVVPSASINIRFVFVESSTSVYNPSEGVAGRQFYAWGASFETATAGTAAYATSYIPTLATSVTRNADSFTESNIFSRGMITAAGGTWFVELRNNVARLRDAGGWGIALTNNNTSYDFGFLILTPSSIASRTQILTRIGGVGVAIYTTTADTCKLAIKWNGSTADVFENGVKVVSSVAFTNTAMQNLSSAPMDTPKYINQMALYPTPLSDSELISMTTI